MRMEKPQSKTPQLAGFLTFRVSPLKMKVLVSQLASKAACYMRVFVQDMAMSASHEQKECKCRELQRRTSREVTEGVMRRCKLRWCGHVEWKGYVDWLKACSKLVVDGTSVGRPKKSWWRTVSADMSLLRIDHWITLEHLKRPVVGWLIACSAVHWTMH